MITYTAGMSKENFNIIFTYSAGMIKENVNTIFFYIEEFFHISEAYILFIRKPHIVLIFFRNFSLECLTRQGLLGVLGLRAASLQTRCTVWCTL